MKPSTGNVLRLLGPLIQIVCLSAWLRATGDEPPVLGVPLRAWLMAGLGLGALMVVAGLTLVRRPSRTGTKIPDLDLDR